MWPRAALLEELNTEIFDSVAKCTFAVRVQKPIRKFLFQLCMEVNFGFLMFALVMKRGRVELKPKLTCFIADFASLSDYFFGV